MSGPVRSTGGVHRIERKSGPLDGVAGQTFDTRDEAREWIAREGDEHDRVVSYGEPGKLTKDVEQAVTELAKRLQAMAVATAEHVEAAKTMRKTTLEAATRKRETAKFHLDEARSALDGLLMDG